LQLGRIGTAKLAEFVATRGENLALFGYGGSAILAAEDSFKWWQLKFKFWLDWPVWNNLVWLAKRTLAPR
jgi:hypothetical protein